MTTKKTEKRKDESIFKESDVAEVKKQVKERVINSNQLSEEDQEVFEKIIEEAKMPVELSDDEFKLGENELDIRNLSDRNIAQMLFRTNVLNNVYLRNIATSFIDIIRLLMLVLKKLGYSDIENALDELITELKNKRN